MNTIYIYFVTNSSTQNRKRFFGRVSEVWMSRQNEAKQIQLESASAAVVSCFGQFMVARCYGGCLKATDDWCNRQSLRGGAAQDAQCVLRWFLCYAKQQFLATCVLNIVRLHVLHSIQPSAKICIRCGWRREANNLLYCSFARHVSNINRHSLALETTKGISS